jgi:hypothetical protein
MRVKMDEGEAACLLQSVLRKWLVQAALRTICTCGVMRGKETERQRER